MKEPEVGATRLELVEHDGVEYEVALRWDVVETGWGADDAWAGWVCDEVTPQPTTNAAAQRIASKAVERVESGAAKAA